MNAATFRIFAGNQSVDILIETVDPLTVELLLNIEEGEPLESSVFLRKPRSNYPDEIRCFLSAMHNIRVVESDAPDGKSILRFGDSLSLGVKNDVIEITMHEEHVKNPVEHRRTLAGNLSLLYSYSLYLFEKKHGIISYHSSALIDEGKKRIYITGGDASSGKSVLMLEMMAYAREHGKNQYRVISSEMGHLGVKDSLTVYTGAQIDNVALFPGEHEKIALMKTLFPDDELPDPDDSTVTTRGTDGSVKTPVSVAAFAPSQKEFSSTEGYRMVYLMPTIKVGKAMEEPRLVHPSDELLDSLVKVAQQKLGKKKPNWLFAEELEMPVGYFAGEADMERQTIAATLKDPYFKAVVEIHGDPTEFNKHPGEYWKKIEQVLE